ncbi:hypothetical protein [Lacrimispora brassicae]
MNKFKEQFKHCLHLCNIVGIGGIRAEGPNLSYSVLEKLRTFIKISSLNSLPILKAIFPAMYILSSAAARLHTVKISIRPLWRQI